MDDYKELIVSCIRARTMKSTIGLKILVFVMILVSFGITGYTSDLSCIESGLLLECFCILLLMNCTRQLRAVKRGKYYAKKCKIAEKCEGFSFGSDERGTVLRLVDQNNESIPGHYWCVDKNGKLVGDTVTVGDDVLLVEISGVQTFTLLIE